VNLKDLIDDVSDMSDDDMRHLLKGTHENEDAHVIRSSVSRGSDWDSLIPVDRSSKVSNRPSEFVDHKDGYELLSNFPDEESGGAFPKLRNAKVDNAASLLFSIVLERCKNRITLNQFLIYVRYFKKQILQSSLLTVQKLCRGSRGTKDFNLTEFRKEIFGSQPEFYGETLWIFEQVFNLQKGTFAFNDGDYFTNRINLSDTLRFLSHAFPEFKRFVSTQVTIDGGVSKAHTDIRRGYFFGSANSAVELASLERLEDIVPSLSLEAVIKKDINILHGDHEVFKDEFQQFKQILGVETNSSALEFFDLMRKHEETITWKQVADLLQFLREMQENVEVAIRNDKNCPRAEYEDPIVGELKGFLKIESDDHASWLFNSVARRNKKKITWLEIREYLEEWDNDRGKVIGHFEEQAAKRITDQDLKTRIDQIHNAIINLPEENCGIGQASRIQKQLFQRRPSGRAAKLRINHREGIQIMPRMLSSLQILDGKPPQVFIFGTNEDVCGSLTTNLGYICISVLDMRASGFIDENVTLIGKSQLEAKKASAFLEKEVKSRFLGMSTSCTGKFLTTFGGDLSTSTTCELALESACEDDIAFVLSKLYPSYTVVKTALSKGLHVMFNLSFTVAQYEELLGLSLDKNRVFAFYNPLRHCNEYLAAKEQISKCGDLLFCQSIVSNQTKPNTNNLLLGCNFYQIDFHVWCLQKRAIPKEVTAVANTTLGEVHSVTIIVKWINIRSDVEGIANYIECWGAGDDMRERFYHWGSEQTAELNLQSNCKKMNLPDSRGRFMGQSSSYYQALKDFIDSTKEVNEGSTKVVNFSADLDVCRTVCIIVNCARASLSQKRTISVDQESLRAESSSDRFSLPRNSTPGVSTEYVR